MSRKIYAGKNNSNCMYVVYMSIKLVLKWFKLFILFLLTFFQHLHVELYIPTHKLLKTIACIKTSAICHFCQKIIYIHVSNSIIILPNCILIFVTVFIASQKLCVMLIALIFFILHTCKNMCNKWIKVLLLCAYSLVYIWSL